MTQPRNITPKRLGKSAGAGVSAKAFSDTSQGRAMEQPAPFRMTRRDKALERNCEKRSVVISMLLADGRDQFAAGELWHGCDGLVGVVAVEELRAQDDGVDHAAELVAIRGQVGLHLVHQRFIRKLRRTVKGIGHQLAAQIADEVVLAVIAYEILEPYQPVARDAAGIGGGSIDRPSRQVLAAGVAHRAIAFKGQAEGVETQVATGAERIPV